MRACRLRIRPSHTDGSPPIPASTAGFAAAVPAALTGLHWFVHSLATPMRFSLCQPGVPVVHGAAVAHFEKNWGRSFPSAWIWAQGLNLSSPLAAAPGSTAGSAAGSSSGGGGGGGGGGAARESGVHAAFALAGGKLPTPLVPEAWMPTLWLLGVRTRNYRQAAGGRAGGRRAARGRANGGGSRQPGALCCPALHLYLRVALLQLGLPPMELDLHRSEFALPQRHNTAAHRLPAADPAGRGGAGERPACPGLGLARAHSARSLQVAQTPIKQARAACTASPVVA